MIAAKFCTWFNICVTLACGKLNSYLVVTHCITAESNLQQFWIKAVFGWNGTLVFPSDILFSMDMTMLIFSIGTTGMSVQLGLSIPCQLVVWPFCQQAIHSKAIHCVRKLHLPWQKISTTIISVSRWHKIDRLMQVRRNTSVLAMELHLPCTKPSKCKYTFTFLRYSSAHNW